MHPALEEAALSLGSKPLRVFVFITIPYNDKWSYNWNDSCFS